MTDIQSINEEIQEIVDVILATVPVVAIYLFGSHATGTAREDSDFDFYVVIPDGELQEVTAAQQISRKMANIQKRCVDMLVGTLNTFNEYKYRKSFVEREIMGTGVKLYG